MKAVTLRCLPGLWFSCKVTCVGDSIKMAKFLGSAQGVCTVGQTGPFIQESQLQHKTHGRHTTPGAVPEFRCVLPFQEGLRGPRLVLRRRRPGPEQLQRPVPQVGDRSAARSTWRLRCTSWSRCPYRCGSARRPARRVGLNQPVTNTSFAGSASLVSPTRSSKYNAA